MTRTAGELAKIKYKMLELLVSNPDISTAELSRLVGIDFHTGAKYRIQITELILTIKGRIEADMEQKITKGVGIWQKIAGLFN